MLKAFCVFALFSVVGVSATQFEVVTYNARWLGLTVDDPRTPNPKPKEKGLIQTQIASNADFMKRVINPQSLVVFQEVVDLNALKKILPLNWSCDGYRSANIHHQHVVLCVSPRYRITNVPYDRNKVIEGVETDQVWSRPAVRADILDHDGQRILRVVGLHLKAAPNFSNERIRQMRVVAQDLRTSQQVPVIILGDMNTYSAKETGQMADDTKLIERVLKQVDQSFTHLPHREPYTFRSPRHKSQFDHIYFNGRVKVLKGPDVFDVCSQTTDGQGYLNFNFYYQNVSDHCPVKAVLTLQH